ncbi:matrixin family metalloprotease [Lactiplantibacillus xiangfangensis]|uniref:matrixin family metalloprotease n=1 Tax=Lactiplantibacillus xiangfangensis TaxID=942150 RepID=UPI00070F2918|nr:matrixin family metalloprotease [Lactiplantibacillus xiangfangensis]
MSRERSFKLSLTVLAVLVGIGFTPMTNAGASATPFARNRWPRARVTYVIQGAHYDRSVYGAAIRAWNRTGQFKFVAGTRAHHQLTLTTSKATTGEYYQLAGITFMTGYNNGYYTQGLVKLLTRNFWTYRYSYWDEVHVAEHELGHCMGLQHSTDRRSVMLADNRYNGISRADIAAVRLRYRLPVGEL